MIRSLNKIILFFTLFFISCINSVQGYSQIWNNLSNNGWVTRQTLQNAVTTGVFTLKSGQTIPNVNITKWIDISEATTWCNLTINSDAVVTTNNQWPQKSWLIPATPQCPSGGVPAYATTTFYTHDFQGWPDCFYLNPSDQKYYTEPSFINLASGFVYSDADSAIWRQMPASNPNKFNHVNTTYNHFVPGWYSSFDYLGNAGCQYGYNGNPHSGPPPAFTLYVERNKTYEFTVEVFSQVPNTTSEVAFTLYQGSGNDPAPDELVYQSPFYNTNQGSVFTFTYTTTSTQFQILDIGVIGKDGIYCTDQSFAFKMFYKQIN